MWNRQIWHYMDLPFWSDMACRRAFWPLVYLILVENYAGSSSQPH